MKRRRLIVESAAACFIEKGFHQSSIRDIARKAGISLGNVYNHFESKAALIAEISALEGEELEAIEKHLAQPGSPEALIERFAGSYFDILSKPENAVLSAEITAEALRNPEVAAGFLLNRDRLIGLLSRTLSSGRTAGQIDPAVPADEMAALIVDLVEGAATRVAFAGRKQKTKTRKSVVAMIQKAILA